MHNQEVKQILLEWADEFNESLNKTNALCVALFSADKKLLFATPVMNILFKGEPYKSLINPTFDRLLTIKSDSSLVFEGLLTIGDYTSINSSILAQVYLKKGKLLVIGGADTAQLVDNNISMHHLNLQINNLQRQLLKEKLTLENTLNQLSEANLLLQQVNDSKDKFFSIIAHDLKSPFNSILGFSEILVENAQEKNFESIEEYATVIHKSSKRAMNLLLNLMEWAQSQTGRMIFAPEVFNLDELTDEIVLMLESSAFQKMVQIKKIVPPETIVYADKAMVSTILRNLISNAIKFSYAGGEISVSVTNNKNGMVVAVSDTGIGIPKNIIGKLFQVDQNITTPGTQNEQGTGLGLILCKEFIEKHGGIISVESEPGKGSKFYFNIPNQAAQPEKTAKNPTIVSEGNQIKKLKILIAEDDEASEMLISIEVGKFSKKIITVRTGTKAVEACRNNPDIDLVLMDIQMPGMSGYEATRQIRDFNKNVVIIAQTAFALSGDREKAIEAGCNDYIAKPIKKEELLAMIKKYFGK